MFLKKYVNKFYLELIYDNYEIGFLNSLDEEKFVNIYNLLKENKFYFIDDIILKYLEIFKMEYNEVFDILTNLRNKLGENYVYIIGNDMSYLEKFLN